MKTAIISAYDKTGIAEFALGLTTLGYEIISTSKTADHLRENKIKVKTIEEITGAPEILGGRVKTLQYQIFAGILADRGNQLHMTQISENGFPLIDLVCINLYPFVETIEKPDCTPEEATEQIDIGGVSLIRAAAKNYRNVNVIVDRSQYDQFLNAERNNQDIKLNLAADAFRYIAEYDISICDYFRKISGQNKGILSFNFTDVKTLRYGENPHQKSWLYESGKHGFSDLFRQIHGKELSYINILDIDSAYNLIREFQEPACAIIKHSNPCGVAEGKNITEAYRKAFATDTNSPFGGIVIVNRELDRAAADEIDKIFTEIVIAPEFSEDALEFLCRKKNRRIIKYTNYGDINSWELRSVNGGLLIQDMDKVIMPDDELNVVTERKPTDMEIRDMIFAMKVCKHTKSNAVVFAREGRTLGIGGGQTSRVDSGISAVSKAKRFGHDLKGSVVASDAFFPFPDGIIEVARAGASAVIQPGGSVRDGEVISAANDHGLAMIFTGIRHFKH